MKKIISLSGFLLVFSLIMITSQVSAESKVTGKALISSSLKNHTNKPAVRGLSYGEFFSDWNDWYYMIVDRPIYLSVNNVFIGKLTISRNNRLEVRTPVSGTMMTHVTLGRSGVSVLQDTRSPKVGLGITTRLSERFMFDTSVNFDLGDTSNVTYWLTLPAIRF